MAIKTSSLVALGCYRTVGGLRGTSDDYYLVDRLIDRMLLGPNVLVCSGTVISQSPDQRSLHSRSGRELSITAIGDEADIRLRSGATATGDGGDAAHATGDAARVFDDTDAAPRIEWLADEVLDAGRSHDPQVRRQAMPGYEAATGGPPVATAGDAAVTGGRANLREYGAAQRFTFARAATGDAAATGDDQGDFPQWAIATTDDADDDGETPAWARATCVAAAFIATASSATRDDAAAAATGDGSSSAIGLALPLYDNDDDPNHNPDFEHDEVPQWALDEWEQETRDHQAGVASSATGVDATTGGGNGGTSVDPNNMPPASRDVRLIPSDTDQAALDAALTMTPPSDTDQAALDAARADEDKWVYGSRVPWWGSDEDWTDC